MTTESTPTETFESKVNERLVEKSSARAREVRADPRA